MLRKKTGFPRAAMLWPETIKALKALPRKGPYVFTSPHGTRYQSSRARANAFDDLRTRAGVPKDVCFSMLRDGAYTAASNGTKDARLAKVLAGHSSGMDDKYVLRNPDCTASVCQAVHDVYFAPPQALKLVS